MDGGGAVGQVSTASRLTNYRFLERPDQIDPRERGPRDAQRCMTIAKSDRRRSRNRIISGKSIYD